MMCILQPVYGRNMLVNSTSCSKIEKQIEAIHDAQRQVNKPSKADSLNRLMREHKTLLFHCRKKSYF